MTTTPNPENQLELCPPDLIAFYWAETLSAGEQSVLLASSLRRLQNTINACVRAGGEEWRQGMRDAAKEVCDACGNEERYGPARKIKGSTRWWHGDDTIPCEAGGIWQALQEHATTPPAATAGDAQQLHWPFAAKHPNRKECAREYEPPPPQSSSAIAAAKAIVDYLALPDEAEPEDSDGSPTNYIAKIIDRYLQGESK